jgi:ABC-type phosphate/phosphonate transport system substrate-binding protein
MAVLHGLEYGRLRDKCRDCKPLLVAVQETLTLKAEVLTQKENPARGLADLKGKRLALPRRPQAHTLYYLERSLGKTDYQSSPRENTDNTDAAIEAVVEGGADYTVIGNAAWDVYRDRKPGRAKRLKVVEESPEFPSTVIVYNELESNEEVLKKFRDNLLSADQTREGRQTLNLWRISSFQDVPKDYERQVDEILRRYPAD